MKWTDSGGSFEQPEPGTYAAVCYKLVDIGTQVGEYQGQKTIRRQVIVGWEINELMTTKEHAGKPFVVSKFYTQSLHENATLRHDLAGWRGRDFTPEELLGFNAKDIIGKSCMLSLVLNEKNKINIASVSKLPKGMEAPKQINDTVYLSLEPGEFNHAAFDIQSEKIKAMITASPEWELLQAPKQSVPDRGKSGFEDMADDIPF